MKLFLDLEAVPDDPNSTTLVGTSTYMEVQEPGGDDGRGVSYTYVNFLEPGSFIVSACWGHQFDEMAQYLNDPKMGGYWLEAYSEPWPTFGRLLRNSSAGRLADGCLVNFQDPDDGEPKWHVVTFVGNLPHTTEWGIIADEPRVMEACQLVFTRSVELLTEVVSGRDISVGMKAKGFLKATVGAQKETFQTSLVWLDRIDQITRLLGS